MLTAALAVLCALLVLVLLVQRPAIWPVLVVLAVLWFALFGVFRYRVRSWVARWVCGGSFEKSKTQFSLEPPPSFRGRRCCGTTPSSAPV